MVGAEYTVIRKGTNIITLNFILCLGLLRECEGIMFQSYNT